MKLSKILFVTLIFSLAAVFAASQTGILEKPRFGVADIGEWERADDSGVEIESEIWVENKNPIGLSLDQTKIDYKLEMNNVKLAEGNKEGFNIQEGNQTVEIHTLLIQDNLQEWWVSHMRNNEKSKLNIPIKVSSTGPISLKVGETVYTDTVETDIEKSINNSVSEIEDTYRGPKLLEGDSFFSELSRPQIEVVDATAGFGEINQETTQLIFKLDIKNMNIYSIPAPRFEGNLDLNGIRMAEWDANSGAGSGVMIDSGETEQVSFQAEIDNSKIDEWLVAHIRNREYSEAELDLRLKFDTDSGSIEVPSDGSLTCSFGLETAILEDSQRPESEFYGCEKPF